MSLANKLASLGMAYPLAQVVAGAIEGATAPSVDWDNLQNVPPNVTALAEAEAAPYSEVEADLADVLVGINLMEPDSA